MKTNYKHVSLILLVLMVALQLNFVSAQNVGIGTATPTEKLDVLGNLKFTGALMPNNLPGTSGQILISQGAAVAPIWKDIDSIADIRTFTTNAILQVPPGTGNIVYSVLPGLTYSLTVPAGKNHKIFISAYGTCSKSSSLNNEQYAQYEIFVDGINTGFVERVTIGNELTFFWQAAWAISGVVTLTGGTHTVDIRGAHATTSAPDVILCQPAGFVGQAVMNLLIIRD
jgi:hypothetical protein